MNRLFSIPFLALLLSACQTPSTSSNFSFRSESYASGSASPWTLKIKDGKMRYRDEQGAIIVKMSDGKMESFDSFRSANFRVQIVYAPCRDTRSGRLFLTNVSVTVRGSVKRGCGGLKLKSGPLEGSQWRVVSLDGSALPSTQLIEVRFIFDRIIATTGCNRYSADYVLKFNKLRFRTPQTIKLYCEVTEEIADQQFIDMISGETEFEFLSDGQLSIVNRIERQLLLKQTL
jgi:heat shock protein HslJ